MWTAAVITGGIIICVSFFILFISAAGSEVIAHIEVQTTKDVVGSKVLLTVIIGTNND